ncbi:MAG: co-chaperone YbbN [Gammaproteobacteria bacterium]|nr:co-chaperone YbbN [Gammaproteobacteria bacterium]MBU1447043.1 co-chaperone YbbN [Gammaproteobacteria bacterium]
MFSQDVNQTNFEEQVMAASFKQPVVIDFWAPWCAPCKVLKPLLEKLAEEYAGKFLLAKVNSDENPDISAQFAVRGIPAVKAVVNGKVVDEFTGALPEGQVRAWLDKIIPSPAEEMRHAAQQRFAADDVDGALQQLAEASALDPSNEWVRVDSAEILLAQGKADEALQLLESVRDVTIQKDDRVLQLVAQARVAEMAAGGEDEASLSAAIVANANDLEARLKLANVLVAKNRAEEGMDQLLEIVRRDRSFRDDIGRKTLLDVFNLLGGSGELVKDYRRKLAGLLN